MQEDFESTWGLTAVIRTLNSPHWEEVRYAYHHTELNTVTLRNRLETKLIEKKKTHHNKNDGSEQKRQHMV